MATKAKPRGMPIRTVRVPVTCEGYDDLDWWVDIWANAPQSTRRFNRLVATVAPLRNLDRDSMTPEDVAAGEKLLDDLAVLLSEYLLAWNLTDTAGDPLPSPHRNPEALMLPDELTWWLFSKASLVTSQGGHTAEQLKNSVTPSTTTT